ncbi:MAG: hypothetical protein ACREPE_13405 [Lysobacter sp.]
MNIQSTFPFGLSWTPQDIADAVPLRLFELFEFDAGPHGSDVVGRCANHLPRRSLRNGYLRQRDLPAFIRVHS